MLRREDDALHPSSRQRVDDRIGVESRRMKQARMLVAVAPLLVGERIHREVKESVNFELVPSELTGAWQNKLGTIRRRQNGPTSGHRQEVPASEVHDPVQTTAPSEHTNHAELERTRIAADYLNAGPPCVKPR